MTLVAARERSAAVAALQETAETLVHDLKQPLTTIIARAQLIDEVAADLEATPGADMVRDWSRRIADSGAHMASPVNELSDVAQLRVGRPLKLDRTQVDLVALARRVVEDSETPQDPVAHIHIEARVETLIGWWDPNRLERIIRNLLDNALKYSSAGADIHIVIWAEGDEAVLQVRDNGRGIPATEVQSVFEWFSRGSNVAGVHAGTGLGLAGVRQIVQQHGGRITLETTERQGSTFSVYLPRTPQAML